MTNMNAPLGFAVGNANEVAEALAVLEGRTPERFGELVSLCVEFAALMVSLTKDVPLESAREECRARLADGSALAKFRAMVAAQGGDLDRFAALLQQPTFKFCIQAMRSGFVEAIDAEKVARVAFQLGAGRAKAGDKIDPRAGVTLAVKRGDRVVVGAPLATLETSHEPEALERCAADLLKAFTIASAEVPECNLVLERIA